MEKTKNIIVYEYLINKLVSSKLMLVCDLKKKNISLRNKKCSTLFYGIKS